MAYQDPLHRPAAPRHPGRLGLWRLQDPDFDTVVTDLLDAHYTNPVRVVAFNVAKGWARDVSTELPRRCDLQIEMHEASRKVR